MEQVETIKKIHYIRNHKVVLDFELRNGKNKQKEIQNNRPKIGFKS